MKTASLIPCASVFALLSLVVAQSGCGQILGVQDRRPLRTDADSGDPLTQIPDPVQPNSDGTCDSDRSLCEGLCVSITDPKYGCGASSCSPCSIEHGSASCSAGSCAIGTCEPGRADCDGVVENGCEAQTTLDPAHCGACAIACAGGQVCNQGSCGTVCSDGTTNCSGACVDLSSNEANCGACNKPCTAPTNGVSTCSSSKCGVKCNAGFLFCNGQCVAENAQNCGATCTACTAPTNGAATCSGGTCGSTCNTGFTPCATGCCAPSLLGTSISSGFEHTCAIVAGGAVKCWGDDMFGELGDGATVSQSKTVTVAGLSGVTSLAAGNMHTCALLAAGTVKCWGHNFYGELGDGTTTDEASPVNVVGLSGVTAISAGESHVCALLADGTVKCWGLNSSGELGDGTLAQRTTPVSVPGLSGVTAIAAGTNHTCALLANGTVKCWGRNGSGQLGDGTIVDHDTPTTVTGLSGVKAIATGLNGSCALLKPGPVVTAVTAACWGAYPGDGTSARLYPVIVPGLSDVTFIASASNHTCAVLPGGTARCWGPNGSGELGDGTTNLRNTPVVVKNLSGVSQISIGSSFNSKFICALLTTGTAKCWGNNDVGELGDGTTTNSQVPVSVVGIP